jgi:hypothetical protein
MIPGYIPDGFQVSESYTIIAAEDGRKPFVLHSPSGSDVDYVGFMNGDGFIKLYMSSFLGGTLDVWLEIYQIPHVLPEHLQGFSTGEFRAIDITEIRTIGDMQVAILEIPGVWITAYVQDDQMMVIESTLSPEEHQKVFSSLFEE